jgi:hypothetical protein
MHHKTRGARIAKIWMREVQAIQPKVKIQMSTSATWRASTSSFRPNSSV